MMMIRTYRNCTIFFSIRIIKGSESLRSINYFKFENCAKLQLYLLLILHISVSFFNHVITEMYDSVMPLLKVYRNDLPTVIARSPYLPATYHGSIRDSFL